MKTSVLERIEFPSQVQAITCTRLASGSLFMLTMMHERSCCAQKNLSLLQKIREGSPFCKWRSRVGIGE